MSNVARYFAIAVFILPILCVRTSGATSSTTSPEAAKDALPLSKPSTPEKLATKENSLSVDKNPTKEISEMAAQKIAANKAKTFTIYVILWAGKDMLFKGFSDYLERQKIKVNYVFKFCQQNKEKCHNFVKEIKQAKPDLIFTWGTSACEAIAGTIDAPNKQDYIWDIPIISLIVTDPIKSKVIFDLNKTGRNVTGVNHVAPVSSHIEAMKSYLKDLKKVAALYNPKENNAKIMVGELKKLGSEYGLEISDHPVPLDKDNNPSPSLIPMEIDKIAEEKNQFIYIPPDTFLSTNIGVIMEAANKHKILTMGTTELAFFSNQRPLMGFLSRYYDVGTFGGYKAEQVLIHNKKPEEIPFEKLKTFSLLLSAEVFRNIGIYPPLSILNYAEIMPEVNSEEKRDSENGTN